MFVIDELQTIFYIHCEVTLMLYLCSEFHAPVCSGSLVITIKLKAEDRFQTAAIVILDSTRVLPQQKLFSHYLLTYTILGPQSERRKMLLAHHNFARLPCCYY